VEKDEQGFLSFIDKVLNVLELPKSDYGDDGAAIAKRMCVA